MTPGPALFLNVRRHLFALIGAVVLAAACLQAVEPIVAPLERNHGSAFSSATVEVAVVRPRASEAQRLAPAPVPLPTGPAAMVRPIPSLVLPAPVPARPDSTGPPRAFAQALRPEPRAPPRF